MQLDGKDRIIIDNLETYAYHGVFPEENKAGQSFYFDVVLYTDIEQAGKQDDLQLSTDYGEVCHFINDWMENNTYKLIETVAEKLCEEILNKFPAVEALEMKISKPEAPVGLPFDNVCVNILRGWHQVYLSVGSNMGDKEKYITDAIEAIKRHPLIKDVEISTLLVTKPYGGVEQEDFVNGAIALKTQMSPKTLLSFLNELEALANRVREVHWGPRTLDLDIVFYDKLVYEDKDLIIPHVDMENRFFVLKPLSELAPNFRHPILQKTVSQLLASVDAC